MKCKLLLNKEPLVVNKLAAKILGLNEAIVVQQIHYWLEINRKAKINQYDGRTWTFNTYEKWQNENFNFWSTITLKRIFKKLFDSGILLKGNYNVKKYDRTLWVSLDYDKLDDMLDKYEENIENSTKYQNDTTVETLENEQSIKMIQCKVSNCYDSKYQNDTMQNIKMIRPIPKTTTKITKEISLATQSTQEVSVVNTNKELIESKTHLLIESTNKINKITSWDKNRLEKSIDIFIKKEGQYFSLLEKIYKDDKNFVPTRYKQKEYTVKTRFHNIKDRTAEYTEEELEALLFENQKIKFNKLKSTNNLTATEVQIEDNKTEEMLNIDVDDNLRFKANFAYSLKV